MQSDPGPPPVREPVPAAAPGTTVVANNPGPGAMVAGPPYNVRLVMAIWFVTAVIDVLIGIRFLLKALGASTVSAFTQLIYGITEPLVVPFRGIFADAMHRTFTLEPGDLVALIIYALIGWGLVALVRIVTTPRARPTVVD